MNPAFHRALRKGLRTAVQLVAGGALTALVTAVAGGLAPGTAALVLGVWTVVVAAAQNGLEVTGTIPTLLPTPGLVPSVGTVTTAVGVVETTVDTIGETAGDVEGVVTDTAGDLLGEVLPAGEEDDDGA